MCIIVPSKVCSRKTMRSCTLQKATFTWLHILMECVYRIRSITPHDRRFRRVSGRWQVSADGRRLYDGVPFGRPFLQRRAPRPLVRIPSSKRARIGYYDEEDDDYEQGVESDTRNQIVLRDEDSNDEDDLDYQEELSAEEIADLAAEAIASERRGSTLTRTDSRKRRRDGLGIRAVHASPPHASRNSSFSSRLKNYKERPMNRGQLGESPKSVRFEDEGIDTPATVLDMHDSEDSEDEDFDATDDESETSDSEANKENIAPRKLTRTTITDRPPQTTDQSSTESDDTTSASESTSSSGDDSSDADSASTSDPSDESSDIESDSERSVSQLTLHVSAPKKPAERKGKGVETANQPLLHQSGTKHQNGTPSKQVAPSQGRTATQKRNARRKKKKQFDKARAQNQQTGEINMVAPGQPHAAKSRQSPEQSSNDGVETLAAAILRNLDTTHNSQAADDQTMDEINAATGENADITTTSTKDTVLEPSSPPQETSSKLNEGDLPDGNHVDSVQQQEVQAVRENSFTLSPYAGSVGQQTSSRRTKLDISGANRMLFSSLGLRVPKTKDDATKLRDELKSKVQQLPGNMLGSVKSTPDTSIIDPKAVEEEDDESWMDKIDLQAVECSYEGVTYSKPPFPFIQRWDPQQQYRYGNTGKRGGRNKRKKRNNKQYYQGDHTVEGVLDYDGYNEEQNYQDQYSAMASEVPYARTGTENVEEENSDTHAANDQLLEEMQAETNAAEVHPNLPDLPADMSVLTMLTIDEALPGCIIAFKQMEMSEHTQWCPVISGYKTAKIEAVLENDILEVRLAARDVVRKEKHYDPKTGERIYSKFELPVDEEEEEEEGDEDRLQIGLQDMIEPKLVQAAEIAHPEPDMSITIDATVDGAQDVLAAGKEIVAATNAPVDEAESVEEAVGTELDTNLQSIKIEPKLYSNSADRVQETTPEKDLSSIKAKDSQSDARTETTLHDLRLASVELGSQNPPQRFFSEPQSGQISDAVVDTTLSLTVNDHNEHFSGADNGPDASITTLSRDDPSIWSPGTGNNDEEEPTQYYSLGADSGEYSSSASHIDTEDEIIGKDDISNADVSEKSRYSAIQSENTSPKPLAAAPPIEDIEASLFVDDGYEESQSTQHREGSMDDKLEEPTFPQEDSSSKGKSHAKNDSITVTDDWNSDTDSSSLLSLKDLLSQPVRKASDLPPIKSKSIKKNKYPKMSSIAQEDPESFIFSQAPKRLISDTRKIAVDMDTNSFHGSSPVEPYELEAHQTDTGASELEDNELQLPAPSKLDKSPDTTRRNRFATPTFQKPSVPKHSGSSKSDEVDTTVVDLTLSSDNNEPDEESSQSTWVAVNTTPRTYGRASKIGSGSRSTVKAEKKSPKRGRKRTKSLI